MLDVRGAVFLWKSQLINWSATCKVSTGSRFPLLNDPSRVPRVEGGEGEVPRCEGRVNGGGAGMTGASRRSRRNDEVRGSGIVGEVRRGEARLA